MTMSSIYDLELHEGLSLNNGMLEIMRVPGGWIYKCWRYDGSQDYEPFSCVFVPFHKDDFETRDD